MSKFSSLNYGLCAGGLYTNVFTSLNIYGYDQSGDSEPRLSVIEGVNYADSPIELAEGLSLR